MVTPCHFLLLHCQLLTLSPMICSTRNTTHATKFMLALLAGSCAQDNLDPATAVLVIDNNTPASKNGRNAAKARSRDSTGRAQKGHFGRQRLEILNKDLGQARPQPSVGHDGILGINFAHAKRDIPLGRSDKTHTVKPTPPKTFATTVSRYTASSPITGTKSRNLRPSTVIQALDTTEWNDDAVALMQARDRVLKATNLVGLAPPTSPAAVSNISLHYQEHILNVNSTSKVRESDIARMTPVCHPNSPPRQTSLELDQARSYYGGLTKDSVPLSPKSDLDVDSERADDAEGPTDYTWHEDSGFAQFGSSPHDQDRLFGSQLNLYTPGRGSSSNNSWKNLHSDRMTPLSLKLSGSPMMSDSFGLPDPSSPISPFSPSPGLSINHSPLVFLPDPFINAPSHPWNISNTSAIISPTYSEPFDGHGSPTTGLPNAQTVSFSLGSETRPSSSNVAHSPAGSSTQSHSSRMFQLRPSDPLSQVSDTSATDEIILLGHLLEDPDPWNAIGKILGLPSFVHDLQNSGCAPSVDPLEILKSNTRRGVGWTPPVTSLSPSSPYTAAEYVSNDATFEPLDMDVDADFAEVVEGAMTLGSLPDVGSCPDIEMHTPSDLESSPLMSQIMRSIELTAKGEMGSPLNRAEPPGCSNRASGDIELDLDAILPVPTPRRVAKNTATILPSPEKAVATRILRAEDSDFGEAMLAGPCLFWDDPDAEESQ
ncbi:hypothetical protein EW146_g229 [Bondarzewia mesenterica]|uniref:Uncharacterized protein n=1 Tax=Bondarzewia mesenterica TaxID=1095465 RepID=A0A4S4M9H6_9AGAM|nr:hypothetical protein EW146_g229 [Bondarzewia mesenterica]